MIPEQRIPESDVETCEQVILGDLPRWWWLASRPLVGLLPLVFFVLALPAIYLPEPTGRFLALEYAQDFLGRSCYSQWSELVQGEVNLVFGILAGQEFNLFPSPDVRATNVVGRLVTGVHLLLIVASVAYLGYEIKRFCWRWAYRHRYRRKEGT